MAASLAPVMVAELVAVVAELHQVMVELCQRHVANS
jgi:hypothetical protein